jgi:hypothetical protein
MCQHASSKLQAPNLLLHTQVPPCAARHMLVVWVYMPAVGAQHSCQPVQIDCWDLIVLGATHQQQLPVVLLEAHQGVTGPKQLPQGVGSLHWEAPPGCQEQGGGTKHRKEVGQQRVHLVALHNTQQRRQTQPGIWQRHMARDRLGKRLQDPQVRLILLPTVLDCCQPSWNGDSCTCPTRNDSIRHIRPGECPPLGLLHTRQLRAEHTAASRPLVGPPCMSRQPMLYNWAAAQLRRLPTQLATNCDTLKCCMQSWRQQTTSTQATVAAYMV